MPTLQEIIDQQKAEANEKATTQSTPTPSETSSETEEFPEFDLTPPESSKASTVPQDGENVQASVAAEKALGGVRDNGNGRTSAPTTPQVNIGESNPAAPPRELPAGITEQQAEFVKGLDSVYQCFHDPEILSHTIRNIMTELQKQPKFVELVSDTDVATMVRGMRDTLGMVQIAKEKTKRGSTTKKGEDALGKSLKVGSVLDQLMQIKG